MANYPGAKLVGVALKLKKKMKKFTVVRSRSPQNPQVTKAYVTQVTMQA